MNPLKVFIVLSLLLLSINNAIARNPFVSSDSEVRIEKSMAPIQIRYLGDIKAGSHHYACIENNAGAFQIIEQGERQFKWQLIKVTARSITFQYRAGQSQVIRRSYGHV